MEDDSNFRMRSNFPAFKDELSSKKEQVEKKYDTGESSNIHAIEDKVARVSLIITNFKSEANSKVARR